MARLPADFWKQHLQLNFHVEGGWYSEVYRSALSFTQSQLPLSFNGTRSACTHIYFLLEKGNFSAFHKIKSDELWHFYSGDPLIIYEISETGELIKHLLGNDPQAGQSLFCVIKGGNWFASEVFNNAEYGLAGCSVSPGFDFNDFELAKKETLSKKYPQYAELIERLCR
ncbi:MAG: cupin domain-containing protein [Chitinophagaceae bacterium]